MNADRSILCRRNNSDHDLNMKYGKEERTLFRDSVGRSGSSDIHSDTEDTEPSRDPEEDGHGNPEGGDLSPEIRRDVDKAKVGDTRVNKGNRSANCAMDNDNINEIKVRTTSFSVSDILDPNKFVGGCGLQRVWHPWLRDEGVRDYTKSNLEKHSEDSSITGRCLHQHHLKCLFRYFLFSLTQSNTGLNALFKIRFSAVYGH